MDRHNSLIVCLFVRSLCECWCCLVNNVRKNDKERQQANNLVTHTYTHTGLIRWFRCLWNSSMFVADLVCVSFHCRTASVLSMCVCVPVCARESTHIHTHTHTHTSTPRENTHTSTQLDRCAGPHACRGVFFEWDRKGNWQMKWFGSKQTVWSFTHTLTHMQHDNLIVCLFVRSLCESWCCLVSNVWKQTKRDIKQAIWSHTHTHTQS